MFSLHTTLEKFVKVKYTGHFEVVLEEIKHNWERTSCDYRDVTGAIIGDGDRKRAPFLVLGLAP